MPKKILPGRPLAGIAGKFSGFSKIRVLDFSKLIPGPFATQALADMGCRVTRVELPHFPDAAREVPPKIDGVGSAYWMVNQGKKQLSFDFRKPAGLKRMRALIKESDVLVEGFRPGLMKRIGLGYEDAKCINPKLVYCSLSGFEPNGPWGRKAGHDVNFMAASGFLGLGNSEGRVAVPNAQIADIAGSMSALSAILAALLERQATKKGRHLQIAITSALHSWFSIPLGYLTATGEDPSLGAHWWTGGHPFYRLYDTQDGRKLAIGALEKGFAVSLLDALGLHELRDLVGDEDPGHAETLRQALQKVFFTATLSEWEERFADKDFCATPVYTLKEAAARLSPWPAGRPRAGRRR